MENNMFKGMMSLEALFSLTVMLFLINFVLITVNAGRLDTTFYEYQLLNDILEVSEKTGLLYNVSISPGNDLSQLGQMYAVTDDLGYCLKIDEDSKLYSENSCGYEPGADKVSTTRIIMFKDGASAVVRFTMWKK